MFRKLVILSYFFLFTSPCFAQVKSVEIEPINNEICFYNSKNEAPKISVTDICIAKMSNTFVEGNSVDFIRVTLSSGATEIYYAIGFTPDQSRSLQTGGNVLRSAILNYDKTAASISYIYITYANNGLQAETTIFSIEGTLPNGISFRAKAK